MINGHSELLEIVLGAVADKFAALFGIGPYRCWRRMRIQESQCFSEVCRAKSFSPSAKYASERLSYASAESGLRGDDELHDLDS